MDYNKIYTDLIKSANFVGRVKLNRGDDNFIYYERHHILPKCLGGDNSKDNLVLLTAREHFIAHKLLVEIYPENNKLINALWVMGNKVSYNDRRSYNIGSREYERLRVKFSKSVSGKNSPLFNKSPWNKGKKMSVEFCENVRQNNIGRVVSKETRVKMSESQSGKIISEKHKELLKIKMTGRVVSEETRNKLRDINIGKKRSKESIQKNIDYLTGKPRSEETKRKISDSLTGRKRDKSIFVKAIETRRKNQGGVIKSWNKGKKMKEFTCPHCGKIGRGGAMKRYHFDNCKLKIK